MYREFETIDKPPNKQTQKLSIVVFGPKRYDI